MYSILLAPNIRCGQLAIAAAQLSLKLLLGVLGAYMGENIDELVSQIQIEVMKTQDSPKIAK